MNCASFELAIVSDDPVGKQQAVAHAGTCRRCARTLAGHESLAESAAAWRDAAVAPAELEERIRRALTTPKVVSILNGNKRAGSLRPRRWRARTALAAGLAAGLLAGFGLAWLSSTSPAMPAVTQRLLAAEALREADTAERQHALAIARLEHAAARLLARALDSSVSSDEAGRLLALTDRLAHLDSTIAEVEANVRENPGYSHSRVMLLAAYREKTRILRDVLALEATS